MIEHFEPFSVRLAEARIAARPDFEWYPYDSLSNLRHIDRLLAGTAEPVLDRARATGVLDLGCADGEISLLFDSLGYSVTAVDNPLTSHNGMRGVRALRERLGSNLELLERDLDAQFSLPPDRRYGLAIVLGLLYHLKNPLYLLDFVARVCDCALVSTRIARCLPDGTALPDGAPLAYLLDAYELNDDNSNYWIFTEPALRRLFRRTRWECIAFFTEGGGKGSDPTSPDRDERAFALLKSQFGLAHLELLEGWYQAQPEGWRWTAREFSLRVAPARAATARRMLVRLYAPPALIDRIGVTTLGAAAGGRDLTPLVIDRAGAHVFDRRVRFDGDDTAVRFTLDRVLPASESDQRELGIVVESVEFD